MNILSPTCKFGSYVMKSSNVDVDDINKCIQVRFILHHKYAMTPL